MSSFPNPAAECAGRPLVNFGKTIGGSSDWWKAKRLWQYRLTGTSEGFLIVNGYWNG